MRAICTYPSRITKGEGVGFCGEAMCLRHPIAYTLIVDIDGLPFNFYILLCDEHADALRDTMRKSSTDIEIGSETKS